MAWPRGFCSGHEACRARVEVARAETRQRFHSLTRPLMSDGWPLPMPPSSFRKEPDRRRQRYVRGSPKAGKACLALAISRIHCAHRAAFAVGTSRRLESPDREVPNRIKILNPRVDAGAQVVAAVNKSGKLSGEPYVSEPRKLTRTG